MNGTINIQLTIVTSKEGKQYIQRWPKDKINSNMLNVFPKHRGVEEKLRNDFTNKRYFRTETSIFIYLPVR